MSSPLPQQTVVVNDLSVVYPLRVKGEVFTAVDRVSFSVESGHILGIVGESGSGKSTIANAMIDSITPPGKVSEGRIMLNGQSISHLPTNAIRLIRGGSIGSIFQDPMTSLNPFFTVGNQIIETILSHNSCTKAEAYQHALDLMREVGIPEPELRMKQYPHQFSGGMRQRIVIAIAISLKPRLIIADEPTTALDVSIQDKILKLIQRLCREHRTACILITHDMGVVAGVTDQVAVMHQGCLVETGDTMQVLSHPSHPYTQSLIAAVPLAGMRLNRFTVLREVNSDRSQSLLETAYWSQSDNLTHKDKDSSESLLSVENVNIRFETKAAYLKRNRQYLQASNQVSFSIKQGEVFGLVGESGSGKSTIAKAIAGLVTPESGRIVFQGHNLLHIDQKALRNAVYRKIQMIFQNPYASLNPRMKVFDIISEPIRVYRLESNPKKIRNIVNLFLDYLALPKNTGERYPHEFSGGQRQRISIARTLVMRPSLLICDEPTSALDVSAQAEILNLLKDLLQELRLTILFISHDLPVVRQMCDRAAVMLNGSIVETADIITLFEHPTHAYSRELISLIPHFPTVQTVKEQEQAA